MTGLHTLLAFSFLVPTRSCLPARILTRSRVPFITFKLQPEGLLLITSADAKGRPGGGGKGAGGR